MPEQIIEFEGVQHRFPEDFTQADIARALELSHAAPAVAPPSGMERVKNVLRGGTLDEVRSRGTFEFPPWLEAAGALAAGAEVLPGIIRAAPGIARSLPFAIRALGQTIAHPGATTGKVATSVTESLAKLLENESTLVSHGPPNIPGLLDHPYSPSGTIKSRTKFTPGREVPEIGVRGANRQTGWTLPPEIPEPIDAPLQTFKPSTSVAKRMRFTPGAETPEIGVRGGNPPTKWMMPSGMLVPEIPAPDFPIPAPEAFKPSTAILKRTRFTPGRETSEIGVSGSNRMLRKRPSTTPPELPIDTTTGEVLKPIGQGEFAAQPAGNPIGGKKTIQVPAAPPTRGGPISTDFPERYAVHDTIASEQAMRKDLAIAQRLKSLGLTPEKWAVLDRASQNSHAKALGFKPFGQGGTRGRAAETGIDHVTQTLRELLAKGKK